METFKSTVMSGGYMITCILTILSFVYCLMLYPKLIQFFKNKNLLEIPDERKLHKQPTPSSGGLLFTIPCLLVLPFLVLDVAMMITIFMGMGLIVLGYVDDRKDLSPKIKFSGQFLVAILAVQILGPLKIIPELLTVDAFWINYLITVLLIVGFTNAFNLLDGSDGLSGSYALVMLIGIAILAIMQNNIILFLMTMTMAGAIAAFLIFNFNPAQIFMGDSGSLFLGYILSISLIYHVNYIEEMGVALSDGLLILAGMMLAVLDTLRVMFSRIARKRSPFSADRTHLHHLLQKLGLKPKSIVYCVIAFLFVIIAYAFVMIKLVQMNPVQTLFGMASFGMLLMWGVFLLRVRLLRVKLNKHKQHIQKIEKQNYLLSK